MAFERGALAVPASDGALRALGYDVAELGLKALGFVIDRRKTKSLVNFPDLNVTLWLDHSEIADVEAEAARGNGDYISLLPNFDTGARPMETVFWMWRLCRMLPVTFVLGVESGDLIEIWDQEELPLDNYYQGPVDVPCLYLGLGLSELNPAIWRTVEDFLGDKLLFSRFLPSGMHKMELALYLRR
ncbi:MAG: hypothetical protein ABIR96_11275 [Bdellovibrionota bacterium]